MAIRIKSRSGESVEQMLRRFKKMCEKEGLTKDVKKHAYYEKPSERRTREKAEAIRRRRKLDRKRAQREGLLPPTPRPQGRGVANGRPSQGRSSATAVAR